MRQTVFFWTWKKYIHPAMTQRTSAASRQSAVTACASVCGGLPECAALFWVFSLRLLPLPPVHLALRPALSWGHWGVQHVTSSVGSALFDIWSEGSSSAGSAAADDSSCGIITDFLQSLAAGPTVVTANDKMAIEGHTVAIEGHTVATNAWI